MILEDFHSLGTLPEANDVLKMQASLSHMDTEQAFNIIAEIPPGPVPVLFFSLLITLNTLGPSHDSSLRKEVKQSET